MRSAWTVWLLLLFILSNGRPLSVEAAEAPELEQLCKAAAANKVSRVKRLLAQVDVSADGCSDTEESCQNHRALHCAVRAGAWEAAKLIVEAGADVNSSYDCPVGGAGTRAAAAYTPGSRCTVLMVAVTSTSAEFITWLVKQGAKLDQPAHENTPLHLAAALGDLAMLETLLRLGAKVDQPGRYKITPLISATRQGSLSAVKMLIEKHAHLNLQTADGATALMWALRAQQPEVALYLISQGADPNLADGDGLLPLSVAIEPQHDGDLTAPLPVLTQLLAKTRDHELVDRDGHTVLMRLVRQGLGPRAELLLQSRALINAQTRRGETALFLAVQKGNVELVRLLNAHGADVNLADVDGMTPLLYLLKGWDPSRLPMLEILQKAKLDLRRADKEGRTALHFAVGTDEVTLVRTLLDRGADVNTVTGVGTTPLMEARTSEIFKLLLGRGAKLDAADHNGWTALMLGGAASEALMLELIARGANASYTTRDGWTPLSMAAVHGYDQVVRKLLRRKIDLNARAQKAAIYYQAENDWTALAFAAFYRRFEVVEQLLQAGADPNIENSAGMPPLILCLQRVERPLLETIQGIYPDPVPTLRILLARGAKVNQVDHRGMTALMWAANHGQAKAVALLLAAGADATRRNNKGESATDLARTAKSEETVRLLPQLLPGPAPPAPLFPPAPAVGMPPGRFPFTAQRAVTRDELARYSTEDLKEMRNEIYARHGRPFKSPTIAEHFAKKSWYKADPSFSDQRLSEIERSNLTLILSAEKKSVE